MRCLVVCQSEFVARTLDEALRTRFEIAFLVPGAPLAKRLCDAGMDATAADPRRTDSYLDADVGPATCVILEDTGRSPRRTLEAIRDAGGLMIYLLDVGAGHTLEHRDAIRQEMPEVAFLSMSELFGRPLLTELGRLLTRQKVLQYQRFFADADRILILLHNDPDPDALASGLALRSILKRNKQTAIIAALHGVTRPENQRMANLLDIHVEIVTPAQFAEFDRVAMVDVQPHYFGGTIAHVDLVVDHHPEQPGYNAVFKDIRPDYGSTCTILTEHLRAVEVNISERTATAMLYAIKSDTLFFARHANRADLDSFTYLYPLGDAMLIRKMEGAEITPERLDYVIAARRQGRLESQVFCTFLGTSPRDDIIPYVADFYLQVENVKWTFVAGIVNESLVVSVRNIGATRSAGDFVRRHFADIGNAGGHASMAKAVVPLRAFWDKFGHLQPDAFTDFIANLALEFLHEHQQPHARTLVKS